MVRNVSFAVGTCDHRLIELNIASLAVVLAPALRLGQVNWSLIDGAQFALCVDHVVRAGRMFDLQSAIRTDLGFFADLARALRALRASRESQRKADGAEQNSNTKP
jgi:hypothetical protein